MAFVTSDNGDNKVSLNVPSGNGLTQKPIERQESNKGEHNTAFPPAVLALSNGIIFQGHGIGASGATIGEVVFNTAMSGYQEILTDPSYHRQIIAFTAPHIGNTGTNPEDCESNAIWGAGAIMHRLPIEHSNWRATSSLSDYLTQNNIVAIAGVDTRRLTRIIREQGAQGACIMALPAGESLTDTIQDAINKAKQFGSMQGQALAYEVSSKKTYDWTQGGWSLQSGYANITAASSDEGKTYQPLVIVLDFGVKFNILRRLAYYGCRVKVMPAKSAFGDIMVHQPNGVLLSNGPGDPEPCVEAIATIQQLIAAKVPTFGICLGHQLLALASGAQCLKMKFGHHGSNHPVQELSSGKVMITSQNHGFAVNENALPAALKVTHRSLFDNTIQGLAHNEAPAFSFQGHPEASPGPQDIDGLFQKFMTLMQTTSR